MPSEMRRHVGRRKGMRGIGCSVLFIAVSGSLLGAIELYRYDIHLSSPNRIGRRIALHMAGKE